MKNPIPPKRSVGAMLTIGMVAIATFLSSCGSNEKSARGFRLPDGDPEKGQLAFTKLGCVQCHSIAGAEDIFAAKQERAVHVELGGEVRRVKTYGHLVTSIINPGHKIQNPVDKSQVDEFGKTKMPDFTKQMTVDEMINLVAYLQPQYQVIIDTYSHQFHAHGYRY